MESIRNCSVTIFLSIIYRFTNEPWILCPITILHIWILCCHTVSFFGHREVQNPFRVERRLQNLIQKLLVEHEYVEFLVGRDGEFDQLVASTIRREWADGWGKGNSEMNWVQAYPSAIYAQNMDSFDDYYSNVELCSEAADAHPKAAIQIRNRHMVERSSLVVFYVERRQGGAFQTLRYAEKVGKEFVNLAEEE